MGEHILAGIVYTLFLVALIVFALTAKSCSKDEAQQNLVRNSKCFEQTQDKSCWGIKN